MKGLFFWFGLVSGMAAVSTPVLAQANSYPDRPIHMIVPFAPGGTVDIIGRLVADSMSMDLGQTVVVENRGGAGSALGTARAAAATPDGYTIIVNNIGLAVNETLRPDRGYNALKDLAPVSMIAIVPSVLVVNNNVPAKSVQDFLALARSQPGKLTFGSAGVGSSTHLSMAYLQSVAQIKLLHVPYRGGGPALTNAIAGEVQSVLVPIPPAFSHIKGGRLRPLGVTSSARASALPNVPTISEAGVPGFEYTTWFGLLAPTGTPKPTIARLNQAIVRGLETPALREKLAAQGAEPQSSTPEEFRELIATEVDKWNKVIAEAGIGKSK
jgi:tripartite-type tricarboxylate transporter receptor subunit TctC